MTKHPLIALCLICLIYVLLAYCYDLIKPQWCDEVWQMIPAANLAFHGFLGMGDQMTYILPTLDSETHMYWYPPLGHMSLALWFKLFGYSLLTARLHTIMWGVVLLLGCYRIASRDFDRVWCSVHIDTTTWKFTQMTRYILYMPEVGIWAALICALDYNFLFSSDARPDIMCAALGVWAIATRSAWLAAAAMMVHPFGVLYPIALTCIKRKAEWIPYAIAIGLWGIYILQDPALWWQTTVNQYIVHCVQIAYSTGPAVYIGFGTGWRLVLLATYVVCIAFVALRDRNITWCFFLLVLPAFFLTRASYYMPHAVPWLALSVAIMMRRYPWLAVILLLECTFAVTSLFPLWNWNGVFNLR